MSARILIVEDEADLVAFLTLFFEDLGYEVEAAVDGDEGFRRALEQPADLITLDLSMPKVSGVRLYHRLRTTPETARVPVVVITGFPDELKRMLSEEDALPEPDAYFEKPVDQALLRDTVAGLTGGP